MATRKEAVQLAFSRVDQQFMEDQKQRYKQKANYGYSGTTAMCALLYPRERKILIANLGGNRCILGKGTLYPWILYC